MLGGRRAATVAVLVAATISSFRAQEPGQAAYLRWTPKAAEAAGRAMRVDGRVGGAWDLRVLRTERSYNYKLRATWMTPDVVRATARLAQLADRLSDQETEALVADAERSGDVVVMFEIDPREGSGVVPLDVGVTLQVKGQSDDQRRIVRGILTPALRDTRALAGIFRRDYAYERFWAVFPLNREQRSFMFAEGTTGLEFVVRIYDKEGRVDWPVSQALRTSYLGR